MMKSKLVLAFALVLTLASGTVAFAQDGTQNLRLTKSFCEDIKDSLKPMLEAAVRAEGQYNRDAKKIIKAFTKSIDVACERAAEDGLTRGEFGQRLKSMLEGLQNL